MNKYILQREVANMREIYINGMRNYNIKFQRIELEMLKFIYN